MFWVDLIPVLLVAFAAAVDLRTREIPDRIWLAILILVPLRIWCLWPELTFWHFPVGGLVALLLACLVAQGDRFGGGDVKLFGALGAWFGLFAIVPLALWIAIAGLPLAVIAAIRKQETFAYGPAILIGVAVHAFNPSLLKALASA